MTDEEYKDYLELKKMGLDVSGMEASVDEYRRNKEAKETGESGQSSGEQAPFIDGVDWVGAYKAYHGSKKSPTDSELDEFRELVGAKATGFSRNKVRKPQKNIFPWQDDYMKEVVVFTPKKGDPKDIYRLATETGYYPKGEGDADYFGEFLRLGNVGDDEAQAKVKSGEWDKDAVGEWERSKAFQNLLASARGYITKQIAKQDAENESGLSNEIFLPSSTRTLKEGGIPAKRQIATDVGASLAASVPAVGVTSKIAFPTISALLSGANEYVFNDVKGGDAAKDAATLALGGTLLNIPGTVRNVGGSPAVTRFVNWGKGVARGAANAEEAQTMQKIVDAKKIADRIGVLPEEGAAGVLRKLRSMDEDDVVRVYKRARQTGNTFAEDVARLAAGDHTGSDMFDSYLRASGNGAVSDLIVEDAFKAWKAGEGNAVGKLADLESINEASKKLHKNPLNKLLLNKNVRNVAEKAGKVAGSVNNGAGGTAVRGATVENRGMANAQDAKDKRGAIQRMLIESDEVLAKRWNEFRPRVNETIEGDYTPRRYRLFRED